MIFLDASLYFKFFQNFLMKIVEDIFQNSCFAKVANMLQW